MNSFYKVIFSVLVLCAIGGTPLEAKRRSARKTTFKIVQRDYNNLSQDELVKVAAKEMEAVKLLMKLQKNPNTIDINKEAATTALRVYRTKKHTGALTGKQAFYLQMAHRYDFMLNSKLSDSQAAAKLNQLNDMVAPMLFVGIITENPSERNIGIALHYLNNLPRAAYISARLINGGVQAFMSMSASDKQAMGEAANNKSVAAKSGVLIGLHMLRQDRTERIGTVMNTLIRRGYPDYQHKI